MPTRRAAFAGLAAAFLLALSASASANSIDVDATRTRQRIEGFGAFGAEKVWWDAPPYFDEAFIDDVVDTLGSTLVRTQLYWDGEPENDDADPNHLVPERFRFGPESDNGKQFSYLKRLTEKGVRIVVTVWTPPPWMKSGAKDALAPFCRGQCGGRLAADQREEFAEYLVAYVRAFRSAVGVEPFALSFANEPLFENAFESCVYDAKEYAETLRVVGGRFEREGSKVRLFGPEHMGDFEWNRTSGFFDAILDEPDVARHLHAFAVHGYLNGFQPDYGSSEGWTKMSERVRARGKELWMTETSEEDDRTWPRALQMAKGLHLALAHGRVSAWIYWAYADRITSARGPLPLHHVLRSWFAYVRPGAFAVEATSTDPRLLVTAFRSDAALTLVVVNEDAIPRDAALEIRGASISEAFELHRTDESSGHIALTPTRDLTFAFPGRSITTLVAPNVAFEERAPPSPPSSERPKTMGCGCAMVSTDGKTTGLFLASALLATLGARRHSTRRRYERG